MAKPIKNNELVKSVRGPGIYETPVLTPSVGCSLVTLLSDSDPAELQKSNVVMSWVLFISQDGGLTWSHMNRINSHFGNPGATNQVMTGVPLSQPTTAATRCKGVIAVISGSLDFGFSLVAM